MYLSKQSSFIYFKLRVINVNIRERFLGKVNGTLKLKCNH